MTIKCDACGDTGSTGEFPYHDCTNCNAAIERSALNIWAVNVVGPRRPDQETLWMVYQHGKEAGRKEAKSK